MQLEPYIYPCLVVTMATVFSMSACAPDGQSKVDTKKEPPATIGKISVETALTTVKLSESAYSRLGISTAPVVETSPMRSKVYGGVVTLPPGAAASIIAPVTGTLVPVVATEGPAIGIGSRVNAGDNLLRFLPLNASQDAPLSSVERGQIIVSAVTIERAHLDASARVETAKVQVNSATTALNRTEQLLRDKVGSQRAVDEAQSALELAQNELNAAKTQLSALKDSAGLGDGSGYRSLELRAPISGIVQNIHAVPGQTIVAGQPLLEISDMKTLWVRVPVFATELADIEPENHAVIRPLGIKEQAFSIAGKPVQGPPVVPSVLSTMDLYFEFSPNDDSFTPGQRVEVMVNIHGGSENMLAVPTAAILYDVLGGAWVYTELESMTFQRSRVEVLYFMENQAILFRGPPAGIKVVTDGAAELFGAEFGNDKK